jgi:hypothetical protein
MTKRIIGYLLVLAIALVGSLIMTAAYAQDTGMPMQDPNQVMTTPPPTTATPMEPNMPAAMGASPATENGRCSQTCDQYMSYYNQNYPTMASREGDEKCWQTCWVRYGSGRPERVAENGITSHDRMLYREDDFSYRGDYQSDRSDRHRDMMMTDSKQLPRRGWWHREMWQKPDPDNQGYYMYNTGQVPMYAFRHSWREAGVAEKKAMWRDMRDKHMRANQCAQACWRTHHNDETAVEVGGWRSEPRANPWLGMDSDAWVDR